MGNHSRGISRNSIHIGILGITEMNKGLIAQFAYQSGLFDGTQNSKFKETMEFAELIVRECAELIDNKEMITALQTYDEVFVAKYDTKEQCSKQILEHFGVVE